MDRAGFENMFCCTSPSRVGRSGGFRAAQVVRRHSAGLVGCAFGLCFPCVLQSLRVFAGRDCPCGDRRVAGGSHLHEIHGALGIHRCIGVDSAFNQATGEAVDFLAGPPADDQQSLQHSLQSTAYSIA
eukprot:6627390-Alexandrium_andersonii.AAC.1